MPHVCLTPMLWSLLLVLCSLHCTCHAVFVRQGFEGLNEGMDKGHEDEWPTANLAKRLALAKVRQGKHQRQSFFVSQDTLVAPPFSYKMSFLRL